MTEHTFPTGITVAIKPTTRYQLALLRASLDIKYPKPPPPTEETELGVVENPVHPDYLDAVDVWSLAQQNRLNVVVLHACVSIDEAIVTESLAHLDQQVAETRAFMKSIGLPAVEETTYERDVFSVDNSPLIRFLYLIAAGGDAKKLMDVLDIIGRSLDSREVIQAVAASMF